MDTITTFFTQADLATKAVLYSVLTILVLSFAIYKMWEKVSFWWLRVMMGLFNIKRLSKDHNMADENEFSSERDLCNEFYNHFEKLVIKPADFDNCSSYLRKAQEIGRKNLPLLGWFLIAAMVFIEAMGFSYVLAGWTIPGASEALKEQGAYGIAFLISGLLVYLTHFTGHELHHNSLVKKVRTWHTQTGEQSKMIPNNKVSLSLEKVDDDDPIWQQLLNRLPANHDVTPSYKVTVATMVFIALIATGSTYVRGKTLESLASEANLNPVVDIYGGDSNFSSEDIYAESPTSSTGLPAELVASQKAVNEEAKQAKEQADHDGAWTTFIILAVIFIFLQLMGILIGFKTGFAGKESSNARSLIGRFRTANEFASYHERIRNNIAQHAQKALEKLQAKLIKEVEKTNIDGGFINRLRTRKVLTFRDYVESVRKEQDKHQDLQEERESQRKNPNTNAPNPSIDIPEAEIVEWMNKLGWDRERTIALLKKQRAEVKEVISEEEAIAMLNSSKPREVSDEEAAQMLAANFKD